MTIGKTLRAALFLVIGVAALSAQSASARDLTVVGWGGSSQAAWRPAYFDPFSAQTKIPVLEDSWSGGLGTLRTKVQSGNPDWDIVQVESDELVLGCEEGLYEPMNWDMLGGRDQFLPQAVNDCGVGEEVYSIGLMYDGDKLSQGPQNWQDFWDVAKFPGKRAMRKGPKLTLEFALLADGVVPAELYKTLRTPEGVDRAFRKLEELKTNIIWWTAGSQPPQLLVSGEAAMAAGYFSRVGYANHYDNKNLKAVWAGSLYQVDFWVILKGSPNKDNAMKFLEFAMRPENQSKVPALAYLGATNIKAAEMSDSEVQPSLPTYPANMAQAIPVDVEFWVDNIEELTLRFNNWVSQ